MKHNFQENGVVIYQIRKKEKMETQEKIVLNYLEKNGSITSLEAFKKFYITRLSAVIFNLKAKGYEIDKVYETNKRTKKHYARYFLVTK